MEFAIGPRSVDDPCIKNFISNFEILHPRPNCIDNPYCIIPKDFPAVWFWFTVGPNLCVDKINLNCLDLN